MLSIHNIIEQMLTKIQKIQTRFYPPGLNIVYSKASFDSVSEHNIQKQLDLYCLIPSKYQDCDVSYPPKDLSLKNDLNTLIDQLICEHGSQINDLKYYRNEIEYALLRIIQKYTKLTSDVRKTQFRLKNSIKVHAQPLTNCLFSRNGDKFATASYDRTCRIWDTQTGSLLTSIKGHRNAVFCLDFSRFSQRQLIATGSLDHTVRVNSIDGVNLLNLKEHEGEVTTLKFNPNGVHLVTGSFDQTIKVWDLEKGKRVINLLGHSGQVIKIDQNFIGDLVLSCSFDNSAKIWDLRVGEMTKNLFGHSAEVNSTKFEYTGEMCATASNDKSCIIWDVGTGKKMNKFQDHTAEIYDLDFSRRGQYLATSSADMTSKVYNTNTLTCQHTFQGHKGEITRVMFLNNGVNLLTTGYDGIGRIWDVELGKNVGLLQGHSQEIFSCDIDYQGRRIITGSKDNVCNLWELEESEGK